MHIPAFKVALQYIYSLQTDNMKKYRLTFSLHDVLMSYSWHTCCYVFYCFMFLLALCSTVH